ncbi:MAG: Na(+)/H(+) antiporter subunit B [Desulfurococcaceae archaeon]|nr:Na(+)/H(+) antiporter subunit B [Desulfurococcaceae archaeon]
MRAREVVIAFSIALAVLLLAYVIELGGLGPLAPHTLRDIARAYLEYVYNPWNVTVSSMALEAVTAIVWDYRGLDTYFETSVLFVAIVGVVTLYRGYRELRGLGGAGLSEIVKTSTRVLVPLILVAGASIAIHGHLTPGGGFQGGSFMAILMVLLVVVFSLDYAFERGLTSGRLLAIRSAGLVGILLTSVALIVAGTVIGASAYVFQNMAREGSDLTMPSWLLDRPLGGTLLFFNVFESLAVVSGLTLAFIVLALRREEMDQALATGEWYE